MIDDEMAHTPLRVYNRHIHVPIRFVIPDTAVHHWANPQIKNTTIYGLPLEVPLFSVAAITFIATCVKISSPYAEMIQK